MTSLTATNFKYPKAAAIVAMSEISHLVRRLSDPDLNRYERAAIARRIEVLELEAQHYAEVARNRDHEG